MVKGLIINMDINQIKLETIKSRILDQGDKLISTNVENGRYYLNFNTGEPISFDEKLKSRVDSVLNQVSKGMCGDQIGKHENIYGKNDNHTAERYI